MPVLQLQQRDRELEAENLANAPGSSEGRVNAELRQLLVRRVVQDRVADGNEEVLHKFAHCEENQNDRERDAVVENNRPVQRLVHSGDLLDRLVVLGELSEQVPKPRMQGFQH